MIDDGVVANLVFYLTWMVSCVLLATLLLFQVTYVLIYRRWLSTASRSAAVNDRPTAIIISTRGYDPSLVQAFEGLRAQTHGDYEVYCVVDSENDPSNEVVDSFIKNDARFRKLVRPETAIASGFKNAAIVHAIELLDERFEFVAFLDADTIPHKDWLRELVAPFADPRVGGTTGNRWFDPPDHSLGAWLRHVWNAAAVVQMYLYGIAWGGSLAIRRQVFEETDLVDRWRCSLCEDTIVGPLLKQNGWKLFPVPHLFMVNREKVRWSDACAWVFRQMLFARLYHAKWPLVFGHGILLFGSSWLPLAVVFAACLLPGKLAAVIWIIVLMLANFLCCAGGLILMLEQSVRNITGNRESWSWSLMAKAPLVLLAGTILFFVQPIGVFWASIRRRLTWRNVRYRIKGPFQIRVESIEQVTQDNEDYSI